MRLLGALAALTLAVAPAAPAAAAPSLAASGCPLFPADSVWHADVSRLPVHPRSRAYLAAMGTGAAIHADFGSGTWEGGPIGIPFTEVPPGQPKVPVRFGYAAESDPGPYPIPPDAPVEGGADAGGDRHVLVVQAGSCRLYELFDTHREGTGWRAGSGAVFDLRSNRLRPAGWTSADAAGLPILAGPVRSQARVILQAMRTHGLVVADNGSSGFIGGVPDERWDNDALHQLGRVTLADFEAVDTAPLRVSPDSAAARPAAQPAAAAPTAAADPGDHGDPGTGPPAGGARSTPARR